MKYCIDCKYHKYIEYFEFSDRCSFGYKEKGIFTLFPLTLCTEKNRFFKCEDYERKWWKFWRPK